MNSHLTPQQTVSDCPSPDTEKKALPNQLFDSGKRSVNTRPTLRGVQSLLHVALLERREGEGAVRPRAQLFGADGFLAHERRGGGRGEGFVLAAVWVIEGLLALLLQMRMCRRKRMNAGSLVLKC